MMVSLFDYTCVRLFRASWS